MSGLSLELFTSAGSDFESAQYRVLGHLQKVRQAFSQNIIYPHLSQLIDLYGSLQALTKQISTFKDNIPGTIKKIDFESLTVVKEKTPLNTPEIDFLEDLVQWALPQMKEAIEEGRTIFEFVEDHLYLEEVGIIPTYTEEGYLLVPDLQVQQVHILQYQLSIFTDASERYRTLRTSHVKSMPQQVVHQAPGAIKQALVAEFTDLPNPATYFCVSELDFPFEPTLLPVAKRKLMRYLYKQDGTA